ncbi:MAG: family 20 glycosylhydrolase [Steroidobacteraceae bacterium]
MIAARHYAAFAAACLAALAACDGTGSATARAARQIIPAPAALEFESGTFQIADGTRVAVTDPRAEPIARYLVDLVARTRGVRLEVGTAQDATGAIRLALAAPAGAARESYELTVSRQGVEIAAADAQGLFYGAVTLWQLVTADGAGSGPATIPALRIADEPRFAWRGLMLDSARHYQPPAFICDLIDWMALHKLNVLHWHLTDDQGWRLEIRKYPLLTQVGAWRTPAGAGRPPRYGGFYSQQEVRAIVAYAAERFVTIVPEIEMPGHAQAAIASYPQLGTGGTPPPVSSDWGVHDYLFNADESTLQFIEDVLAEVFALFPGEYVHIGGDEAVKNRWKKSPRVQARIRELGLADEAALQGWFVARIERFLDRNGRRLIGWDEIFETGIPARASIMSWRGIEGAIAAARAGHDVIMAPAPNLYLDHLQSNSPREPPGRPAVVSLADVYGYEPVPPGLAPAEARHIRGAQLNAWTEHMRLPERVAHQVFPRAAALAEVTWSPASTRDWPGFRSRLAAQFARYQGLGIAYSDSAFEPRLRLRTGSSPGGLRVELSNQAQFGEIRYTLDGSEPTSASSAYQGAFEADAGTRLRAATFEGRLPLSAELATTLDARFLRLRTDETLKQCTGKLVLRLEDDAPLEGERAFFNVDIVNPCWIWPAADLAQGGSLRVAVGQVPFNFQIGADAEGIRHGDARTPAGELEVRIGGCDGEPIALQPLAAAAPNPAVTVLPALRIPPQHGRHDLCLRFARPAIDPIWTIQWAELGD